MLRGPADPLGARIVARLDHRLDHLANMSCIVFARDLALALVQDVQADGLFLFGDAVDIRQSRSVGPRRILEGEGAVVADFVHESDGLFEVAIGLTGEADDDVGGDGNMTARALDPGDALEVFVARVETLHQVEDVGGAALHGQMHVVAEGGNGIDGIDDVLAEIAGVRGGLGLKYRASVSMTPMK